MNLRGWRLFTILSLATNIVFAVLIGIELVRRESITPVRPMAQSKIPGLRDKAITLPPRTRPPVESPTTNWPPFRWSSVHSTSYSNYVANLRNIGCPPETVEAIIRGASWFELATFIHAYATEKHPLLWEVLTGSTNAQVQLQLAWKTLETAAARRDEILDALFQKPADSAEQNRSAELQRRRSDLKAGVNGFLPDGKLASLANLQLSLDERNAEIKTNLAPRLQSGAFQAATAEYEAATTNLLSEAELREHRLRTFLELQERGQSLRGLALIASNSADYASMVASFTNQTAFSQALGPERAARWASIQSTDLGSVNTFLGITRKFGLNPDLALSAAKANSAYRKEEGEIDTDAKLLPRERRTLKVLLEQHRIEKLRALLGSDAWETYRFHHEY